MFCENCRKELEEGSKFCDGCGEKVEVNDTEVKEEAVEQTHTAEEIKEEPPEVKPEPAVVPPPKKLEPEKPKEVFVEKKKTKSVSLTKPLGIFSYIWMFILVSIPLVNIVMIFVWALGKNKNVNKKNFAWASIILWLLFIILAAVGYVQFTNVFTDVIDQIREIIEDIR